MTAKASPSLGSLGPTIELCAGFGGIGLGLREVGFEIIRAYDAWKDAVAVYNHNFRNEVATTCDLLDPDARKIVLADCKKVDEIELLAAGPPCKGFSQLKNGRHDGRKRTNKTHNRVLAVIPDYVALIKPRMVLIENVPALVTHRDGVTLRDLLARLKSPVRGLRYRVENAVYDAAHFGTPQARKRLLILAVREGAGDEHLPKPQPDLAPLFTAIRHDRPISKDLLPYFKALRDPTSLELTTAEQALSDLPTLGPGEPEQMRPYSTGPASAYQEWARTHSGTTVDGTQTPCVNHATTQRLRHVPPGGCARDIPSHELNGLIRRFDSAYRRLHPEAPSTALSTKYDCVYHYQWARSLSLREYARLQGIPDHISFPALLTCRRSAYEMIGNSVPPRLIQGVLLQTLGARDVRQESDNDVGPSAAA